MSGENTCQAPQRFFPNIILINFDSNIYHLQQNFDLLPNISQTIRFADHNGFRTIVKTTKAGHRPFPLLGGIWDYRRSGAAITTDPAISIIGGFLIGGFLIGGFLREWAIIIRRMRCVLVRDGFIAGRSYIFGAGLL